MVTIMGYGGNLAWLVAVLLVLAAGLAGALLAATRPRGTSWHPAAPRRETRSAP